MSFNAGAIVGKLTLNASQWKQEVMSVKQSFKGMNASMKANQEQLARTGKSFAKYGAIIVGGLGLMAKKASDAEETTAKFGTVFESSIDKANASMKELTESYGLSSIASKKLMADTGDILSGFGFTGKASLELSTKVQKLAVDLASFTNVKGGAETASEALTKALVGETERAKALGIVIRQDSDRFKSLVKEGMKTKGYTLLQAKAMASLTIATEQSKNAIGDYARTSSSTANQVKEMNARFEDTIVAIGTFLTPILKDVATIMKSVATAITDFAKKNPILAGTLAKLTLGFGALLTVTGGLMVVVPKVSLVLETLKIKIIAVKTALMAMNPVILAVAGAVAVVTLGTKAYIKSLDNQIKAIVNGAEIEKKSYDKLRNYRRVASEEEKQRIKVSIMNWKMLGFTQAEASAQAIKELEKSSLAYKKYLKTLEKGTSTGKKVSTQLVSALASMKDKIVELTSNEFDYRTWRAREDWKKRNILLKQEGASAKALYSSKVLYNLELKKIEEERVAHALEVQGKQKNTTVSIFGLMFQAIKEKYLAHKAFLNELRVANAEANLEDDALEQFRIDEWKRKQEEKLTNMQLSKELHDEAMLKIKEIYDAKVAEMDEKSKQKKLKNFKEIFSRYAGFAKSGFQIVSKLAEASFQRRRKKLDHWYEHEKTLIEQSTMSEAEKKKALEKLDAEYQKKSKALEVQEAKRKKSMAIVEAIINTAVAVAKALPNIPLSIIAGAMGMAQIALIKSQPVGMDVGGMVKDDGVAMLHKNEVVMPFDKVEQMFGTEAGSMGQTINNFNFHDIIDATGFEKIIDEKVIPILQDRTKDEDFLIHPDAIKEF